MTNEVLAQRFALAMTRKDEEIAYLDAEIKRLREQQGELFMAGQIARLRKVMSAARDLIDLELEEDVPVAFADEWESLASALSEYRENR